MAEQPKHVSNSVAGIPPSIDTIKETVLRNESFRSLVKSFPGRLECKCKHPDHIA